jgi:flagellar hook-length control protein FliK
VPEPAIAADAAKPKTPDVATTPTAAPNGKTEKPKVHVAQAGQAAEHAAAPARPASAPATPPSDKAPDAPDKSAMPPVAQPAHEPAADRIARAAIEARDSTPAAASTASPAPTSQSTTLNPALTTPATAVPSPMVTLRVDTRADAAVPVAGLAVEIVSRAEAGLKRFEIRLDPPDLGRIDVRLDVDRDGKVTSHLIVERTETLDLLKRDAPQLERALQQAGLKTDGGIDFSLRDQSQSFRDQAQRDSAPSTRLIVPDDELPASEAVRGYGRLIGLGGGVDIRV